MLFLHAGLRRAFGGHRRLQDTSDQQFSRRVAFDIIFSIIYLTFLHGFSIFKIFIILTINYIIAVKYAGSIANPILTWTFNLAILFLNEMFDGYKYGRVFPWLIAGEGSGFGHALDELGGFMPRWEIHFNITMLRLISFNMDYYWSYHHEGGAVMEVWLNFSSFFPSICDYVLPSLFLFLK